MIVLRKELSFLNHFLTVFQPSDIEEITIIR